MKKFLILALTIVSLSGCGNSNENNTEVQPSNNQINTENAEEALAEIMVDGKISMKKYYDNFSINDKTFTVGQLQITNNGVTDHDLISISDNLACQTYLSKAKKINLEITNNYDVAVDYSNTFIGDIWDISDIVTDKTIEFMDSGDFASALPTEEDEFYGTLDPFQFQGDYLGECFQQQSKRFVAQPGETVNYPLYFSLQDKFTDGAKDYYLNINPHTFPLPTDHPIKELELAQPTIVKLEI